jgi:hypothetical protein
MVEVKLHGISNNKTKDIIFGTAQEHSTRSIAVADGEIQRITSFKLLGVTISDDLSQDEHVSAIRKTASQSLHFIQLLKWASVPSTDMITYCKPIVRPVIEYAYPVWQFILTTGQCLRFESVQRQAVLSSQAQLTVNYKMPY